MKYYINRGLFHPPIEVEIEGVPPCLFCNEPVTRPSTDGPLVCPTCDMGANKDGTYWTKEQGEEKHKHFQAQILKYVAAQM